MTWKLLQGLAVMACLFLFPCIHAQEMDLVVMENGDSIACRIDSITDTNIYFEMKSSGRWVHTHAGLERVSSYEQSAISRKDYLFQPGTSTIKAPSGFTLQKNSVYLGLGTLCYGRTFPGDPASFTVALGIASPDGFAFYGESTMMLGRNKHYFETGLSTAFFPTPGNSGFLGIIIRAGYRYQGPKGFLFRSAPTLGFIDGEILPLPALSIGYSF